MEVGEKSGCPGERAMVPGIPMRKEGVSFHDLKRRKGVSGDIGGE